MRKSIFTALTAATFALSGQALAGDYGSDKDQDQGTVEDILQSPASEQPAGEVGNQGDSDALPADEGVAETAVPSASQTVSGKISLLDKQSGYFTVQTAEGKDLRLHADPKLLKEQNFKKGDQVTAKYEMQGEMRHVTDLKSGGTGAQELMKQQTEQPEQPATGTGAP